VPQSARNRQFATGSHHYLVDLWTHCKVSAKIKSKIRINAAHVLITMHRAFYFKSTARLRDVFALPLPGLETNYGSQLSLSALFRLASYGGKRCVHQLAYCPSEARRRLCDTDRRGQDSRLGLSGSMMRFLGRSEAAEELREQAASCRRLAGRALTPRGKSALVAVATHFDSDARRLDPRSERR